METIQTRGLKDKDFKTIDSKVKRANAQQLFAIMREVEAEISKRGITQ